MSREGGSISLSWTQTSQSSAYQLWRGLTPYFTPEDQGATMIDDGGMEICITSGANVTCTDVGVIGDPDINHFYMVRAFNVLGAWVDSNRTGEFDFALRPGGPVPPAAPVLSAINHADGDGSYIVGWNMVAGAISYTFEEDDHVGLGQPGRCGGSYLLDVMVHVN